VQSPGHPLTFTPLCRQGHTWARRLCLHHRPPQSQGHAKEQTSCADQPPLPAQPCSPACTTPGEPTFGSALRQRARAGEDCQARLPDRNAHRPNVTCAGDIPSQATCPAARRYFFKVHSICAQRHALQPPQSKRSERVFGFFRPSLEGGLLLLRLFLTSWSSSA
jgi:hypothetical protein